MNVSAALQVFKGNRIIIKHGKIGRLVRVMFIKENVIFLLFWESVKNDEIFIGHLCWRSFECFTLFRNILHYITHLLVPTIAWFSLQTSRIYQ